MLRFCSAFFVLTLTALGHPAHALCIYKGKMNAKTTAAQEFHDSKWVVRVKVLAADDHWSDFDDSWTMYTVQVRTAFKGHPPVRLRVFTYRDSGGFYLDKGMSADLGGEYLLFLDAITKTDKVPPQVREGTWVNYNCGQSKEWNKVSATERQQLGNLAGAGLSEYKEPLPTDEQPR